MYSDEYPDMRGQPAHCWGWGAHAKGVLGFGPQRGFWLTHSIPKTPGHPRDGPYPGIHPPQLKYGQSMMCVSLGGCAPASMRFKSWEAARFRLFSGQVKASPPASKETAETNSGSILKLMLLFAHCSTLGEHRST